MRSIFGLLRLDLPVRVDGVLPRALEPHALGGGQRALVPRRGAAAAAALVEQLAQEQVSAAGLRELIVFCVILLRTDI